VLAWVGLLRSIQGWNSSIALAVGRADALFRLSIVSLVVAAVSVGAGAPFGLVGVAIVYAVLTTGVHAIWLRYCVSLVEIGMRDVLAPLAPVAAATGCMVPILVLLKALMLQLGASSALLLVVLIPAGCVVYALAIRVCAPRMYGRVRGVVLQRISRGKRLPDDVSEVGAS
jgi:O-antigen/teichoic acid export membrane protein